MDDSDRAILAGSVVFHGFSPADSSPCWRVDYRQWRDRSPFDWLLELLSRPIRREM